MGNYKGLVFIPLFLLIVGGAYFLGTQKQGTLQPTITPSSTTPQVIPTKQLVGADADAHGCKGSVGYTWCEVKNKCLRQWEESCTENTEEVIEQIKKALIEKNNWSPTMNLEVTISKREGVYMSGTVREKGEMTGGGYFFAVKDNDVWVIVADGNGIISCDSVDLYPEYPKTFIPQCWDQSTQNVIQR